MTVRRMLRSCRRVALAAAAWSCGTVAPLGAQDTGGFTGDPAAGRRIFVERECVRCHSIWGNGGTLGPDFAVVGAGRSLQQLAGLFWNHTPRMIETVRQRGFPWPTFTEEDLANFISYVYYVKLFDEPGDPELGRRWFREMRCGGCHVVGGTGRRVGPDLDRYGQYIAPIMLAQGMWNSGPAMQRRQAAAGVPMPRFLGREIADLMAFIRQESGVRNRAVQLLEPPDPNLGRVLFRQKGCEQCHGRGGRGSANGPDLREATQRLRVSEIAGQLWNHSSRMASAMEQRGIGFPRFAETEMADIIAFLYYLRYYETEGDIREGERLFVGKGCATCHPRDGGTSLGPDLATSQVIRTPLGLATAMWDHAPAMYDQVQTLQTEWPRFDGDEMRDLSVYLRSLVEGHDPEP